MFQADNEPFIWVNLLWESTNLPLELRPKMSLGKLLIVFVCGCLCVCMWDAGRDRGGGKMEPTHSPVQWGDFFFQTIMYVHRVSLVVSAPLLLLGIVVANNVNAAVIHCVIATTTLTALFTSKYCYSNVFCQSQTGHRFLENSSLMLNLNFYKYIMYWADAQWLAD